MSSETVKFTSMTSYLYDVAFEQADDEYDEICLDCLNQENPWQCLRLSQQKLDVFLDSASSKNQKYDRKIDRLKMQLFILTTAGQRMSIYGELNNVVEQLKPIRQRLRSLEKTAGTLKRINRKQSALLKHLKASLLGARGEAMQMEVQQRIDEIEWELLSLWQRCIGAELDKLRQLEQSLECKELAIHLLDKHLDQYCTSGNMDDAG